MFFSKSVNFKYNAFWVDFCVLVGGGDPNWPYLCIFICTAWCMEHSSFPTSPYCFWRRLQVGRLLPTPLLLAFLYSISRVAWKLQLWYEFETTEFELSNFGLSQNRSGLLLFACLCVFGGRDPLGCYTSIKISLSNSAAKPARILIWIMFTM